MLDTRKIGALAIVAAIASTPALAHDKSGQRMNDLEIAHTAYTAGALDIRYAYLALAVSENGAVRAFAETMIRDHGAVNEAALALVRKLRVAPQNNALSRALIRGAVAKRAELRALDGKAFDCAYAKNELAYHELVNKTVETAFIPAVKVAQLKALLRDALVTFKVHENHARRMVAALQCDS